MAFTTKSCSLECVKYVANTRAQTDLCHMRIVEHLCMLLPKALKMWAFNDTMALVANSIGGTKCASAQMRASLCQADINAWLV